MHVTSAVIVSANPTDQNTTHELGMPVSRLELSRERRTIVLCGAS